MGTPAWRFGNLRSALMYPHITCAHARGLFRAADAPTAKPGDIVLVYRGLACTDDDINDYDASMPAIEVLLRLCLHAV
jgi:hypothetical protein